jgi:calcineurin-like phosphoesterase family protein
MEIPKFNYDECVFISDTHFGHANIIKYCDRPFTFPDTVEMDTLMLKGMKEADDAGKIIFHMGDFVFNSINLVNSDWRPAGQHYLILGNHDKRVHGAHRNLYREFFTHIIGDYRNWKTNSLRIMVGKHRLLLSHTAQMDIGRAHLNLYGHIHNKTTGFLMGNDKYRNACVEVTGYKPLSLEELVKCPQPTTVNVYEDRDDDITHDDFLRRANNANTI